MADFKYISVICVLLDLVCQKKIKISRFIFVLILVKEMSKEICRFLEPRLPIVQLEVVLLNCEI